MASIPPAKKPSTPVNPRRTSDRPASSASNTPNPSRSPSRMAAGSGTATATGTATNGINRTRSVRQGTAAAARASTRKQSDTADEDIRAEMNAKIEELQDQLRLTEEKAEDCQKQNAVLQVKLDDAIKEQGLMDERIHEQTEKIEEMEHERRETLRARRELEQIYETERVQYMKEKEEASAREEELQSSVQRLKEAMTQRETRLGLDDHERRGSLSRNSSFRRSSNGLRSGEQSPSLDAQFAPSSIHRSPSQNSSKLVMQKDKIIEGLRLELAELQIKLVQMENMGGGRMQELEKTMYDVKVQNARLMEENESFQLMLTEKTLNGDLTQSDFLRPPSPDRTTANSRPSSRHTRAQGNSLADELGSQVDESEISTMASGNDDSKRILAENNTLKDQNKALTLYINNIVSRLLQHEQFEHILDKTPDILSGRSPANTDKDLPPPPPPKDETKAPSQENSLAQPVGFLERARSVVNRRPRPQSVMIEPSAQIQTPSKHEDPATAPKIPLGRTASTRGGGHRRANSEWAAGIVGNMYRGPSPGSTAPLSPGLGSPRERTSFFGPGAGITQRVPSGNAVPTIQETDANKENDQPGSGLPQRDSKISSGRNSVASNPAGNSEQAEAGAEPSLSAPTSPPRSTHSGDRDSRASVSAAAGGAVMVGSKMRPLRLVQEAAEEDSAKKAANRGSWFGWMNKGVPSVPFARSVSGEGASGGGGGGGQS